MNPVHKTASMFLHISPKTNIKIICILSSIIIFDLNLKFIKISTSYNNILFNQASGGLMKKKIAFLLVLLSVISVTPKTLLAADPSLDPFYSMGHPSGGSSSPESVDESVDPFSGHLSLVHTDLYLPGNGGLDLKIMRTYSSSIWGRRDVSFPGLVAVNELSPVGVGWTMHMGIVLNPDGTGSDNRFVPDNPVVVMPDGSNHVMYKDKSDSSRFISKDFMVYKKRSTGLYDLTLPDGTLYTFQHNASVGYSTLDHVKVAQVTSIKNAGGGSTITISYNKQMYYTYLRTITDSAGRTVQFNYDYTGHKLTSIVSGSRTISYAYQGINTGTQIKNFLTQVNLPVGTPWKYEYNTTAKTFDLKKLTYPAGGIINYEYGDVLFSTGKVNILFRVVTRRTTSGRQINGGSWTYSYVPNGTAGATTTVTGPDGYKEVHKFNNWGNCPNGNVWKIGLPQSKVVSIGSSTALTEAYTWTRGGTISSNDIANADWSSQGGIIYDGDIFIPLLTNNSITRNGKTYSTAYGSYDSYGNPRSITETGDLTRTTTKAYWYNAAANIVLNNPSSETTSISGITGSVSNSYTYNTDGSLKQANRSGVTTDYTYLSNGNLSTEKDANGRTTTYTWTNGQISKIANPIYTINKTINSDGTVANATDGRGNRTSYTYDNNLRLTTVTPPVGNRTSYTYANDYSSQQETRGGFYTTSFKDGFSRPVGTSDRLGITTDIIYKSYGPKNYSRSNTGDTTYFDYFGRVTQIVHKDNGTVDYTYSASNASIRDEDGKTTQLTYQAFGNPDEKRLTRVTDALANATNYIYNTAGNLTSITQKAGASTLTRTYGYSAKYFLTSESHPDKGSITYGRDNVGNMTSKTDALGTTSYTYDNLNRLTRITAGTQTVNLGYDNANNRTSMANGSASMTYAYDSSNRMTSKSETIAGKAYTTGYTYNANDMITTISYPTGRNITYAYNDNNQPTSVTGFGGSVTGITYHTSGTAIGLPSAYTYSNGITTTLTYNTRNMVSRFQAGTFINTLYAYDSRGNTTAITNSAYSMDNQTFGYDSLNRLTMFNGLNAFTYDESGNRLTKNVRTNYSATYSYTNNRLMSETYDSPGSTPYIFNYNGSGDMTSMGNRTFEYDRLHNVISSGREGSAITSFTYDGDNLRITKTSGLKTEVYHYGQDGNILSETDANGLFITDYIYLFGKLVARTEDAPAAAVAALTATEEEPIQSDSLTVTVTPIVGTPNPNILKPSYATGSHNSLNGARGPLGKSTVSKETSPLLSVTPGFASQVTTSKNPVHWQISRDVSFAEKVMDIMVGSDRSTFKVPALALDGGNTYYVRSKEAVNGSSWSKAINFITEPPTWNDENGNGVPDDMDTEDSTDLDANGVSDQSEDSMKVVKTFDDKGVIGIKNIENVLDVELLESVAPYDIEETKGKPADLPLGLVGVRLITENPGDTVKIGIYLSEPAPENARVHSYDTVRGWRDLSGKATIASDRRRITLTLTDGGEGDADGCRNGVIVEAVGLGIGN